mmetsp:Transcript_1966/g.4442  ORF Transcript_1966/g.4442 Transcript_1966/m.4442 type:complete len:201 (+) Transcript_1966:98-700(+)
MASADVKPQTPTLSTALLPRRRILVRALCLGAPLLRARSAAAKLKPRREGRACHTPSSAPLGTARERGDSATSRELGEGHAALAWRRRSRKLWLHDLKRELELRCDDFRADAHSHLVEGPQHALAADERLARRVVAEGALAPRLHDEAEAFDAVLGDMHLDAVGSHARDEGVLDHVPAAEEERHVQLGRRALAALRHHVP